MIAQLYKYAPELFVQSYTHMGLDGFLHEIILDKRTVMAKCKL